eukprot:tig00000459_g1074.t1
MDDGGRGVKRPLEEEDANTEENALELLPDGVMVRVLECLNVDIIELCRMRAVSRFFRSAIDGWAPREVLLDVTTFKTPERVLAHIVERIRDPAPDLLSAGSLRLRAQHLDGHISVLRTFLEDRVRLGARLESAQISLSTPPPRSALSLVSGVVSALRGAGRELEVLCIEFPGGSHDWDPEYRPLLSTAAAQNAGGGYGGSGSALGEAFEPGLFRPFAKLRALALPHSLPVGSRMAADIAASLPSLRTLELRPASASALAALAPLALERLALAGETDASAYAGLVELSAADSVAGASLRTLALRHRHPPLAMASRIPAPCLSWEPFCLPAAVVLPGFAARFIAALPNLERVEGYLEFKAVPRQPLFFRLSREEQEAEERRCAAELRDDVSALGRTPKLASLQVLVHLSEGYHAVSVLEGLADAARAGSALRSLHLFLSGEPALAPTARRPAGAAGGSGAGRAKEAEAEPSAPAPAEVAAAQLISVARDALSHVTVVSTRRPLPRVLAIPLARLGPQARSLRLAHAAASPADLEPYRELWRLARPPGAAPGSAVPPSLRIRVHAASADLREIARVALPEILPRFASCSFSVGAGEPE